MSVTFTRVSDRLGALRESLERLANEGARRNRLLVLLAALAAALLAVQLTRFF